MDVVVNAAVSADGKLSTRRREQLHISGPEDRSRVDGLRADCDAIAVGVGTVLADDPRLIVRDEDRIAAREHRGDTPQPARIVADSRARTPLDAHVLDDVAKTFVLVTDEAAPDAVSGLETTGATVLEAGSGQVDLSAAFADLESRGYERILVEGGGELLYSIFRSGLADNLSTFVGPLIVGGRESPTLVDGAGFIEDFPTLELEGIDRLDDGVLLRWTVP